MSPARNIKMYKNFTLYTYNEAKSFTADKTVGGSATFAYNCNSAGVNFSQLAYSKRFCCFCSAQHEWNPNFN